MIDKNKKEIHWGDDVLFRGKLYLVQEMDDELYIDLGDAYCLIRNINHELECK